MDRVDLSALDSFAAIARHGNFRRAAVERGVSPSTYRVVASASSR